jgi:hypothetical protein
MKTVLNLKVIYSLADIYIAMFKKEFYVRMLCSYLNSAMVG